LEQKQIIHRDIKLGNFFISSKMEIVLGDFGFAKQIEQSNQSTDNSNFALIGSPNYCSPEILEANDYSLSSDIWAFGILLFYLKTGFAPFEGQTKEKTFKNIKNFNKFKSQNKENAISNQQELKDVLNNYSKVDFTLINDKEERLLINELLDQMIIKCLDRESDKRPKASDLLTNKNNEFFNLSSYIIKSQLDNVETVDHQVINKYLMNWSELQKKFKASNIHAESSKTCNDQMKCEISVSTIEISKDISFKDQILDFQNSFSNKKKEINKILKNFKQILFKRIKSEQVIKTDKLSLVLSPFLINLCLKKSLKSLVIDDNLKTIQFTPKAKQISNFSFILENKKYFFKYKNMDCSFTSLSELDNPKIIKLILKTMTNLLEIMLYLQNLIPIIESQLIDYEICFPPCKSIKFCRALNSDYYYLFITESWIDLERIKNFFKNSSGKMPSLSLTIRYQNHQRAEAGG
jgi:serine/threonine protein kinase